MRFNSDIETLLSLSQNISWLKKVGVFLQFPSLLPPKFVRPDQWWDGKWQSQNALRSLKDFLEYFPQMSQETRQVFSQSQGVFRIQTTPYYARMAQLDPSRTIEKIFLPQTLEFLEGVQAQEDPLGELRHSPVPRVVHRYPDRCLLLATDLCSVYCRYCTRKHFTASGQASVRAKELEVALQYIESHCEIKEVILSGGDVFTSSDDRILSLVERVRGISHVEIIRMGTRIPVVNPMRITRSLVERLKVFHPIFIMTHFNHPVEVTKEAEEALALLVNHGFPVMNQMVLLNGINNHEALVYALSRRLLSCRVKPYYMFQCDPSMGTDHLRTSIEDSEAIHRALWGRASGLSVPKLSLDIPSGGGKIGLTPNFEVSRDESGRTYRGWDGVIEKYENPRQVHKPFVDAKYREEWERMVGPSNC